MLAEYYLDIAKRPVSPLDFAGSDVRYSAEFETLEAELGKSGSLHETTAIDWQKIRETSETVLTDLSKDLRVTVWLIWSLFQRESITGLGAGISMLHYLCLNHWIDLHPRKLRTRAASIHWLNARLERAFTDHQPDAAQAETLLILKSHLKDLDALFTAELQGDAPLLLPLCRRLKEIAQSTAQTVPSPPIQQAPESVVSKTQAVLAAQAEGGLTDTKQAQKTLRLLQDQSRALCAWWLQHKPGDPRALKLSRTLLWLPIDNLPEHNADRVTALRGLPADRLAQYAERFAQGLFAELLVDVEASLARAPFWLDGQHLAWQCLQALQAEAGMREAELQLALLLQRLPLMEELRFHDGAPFASAETRLWISSHVLPHGQIAAADQSSSSIPVKESAAWDMALEESLQILRRDGLKPAVQRIKQGLSCAHSGRERFKWQLAQVRLCMSARKYDLAKTQLESLHALLQTSGLAEWEPDLALEVLTLLLNCCELLPQNQTLRERKEDIYRRLCHLDLEVALDQA